MIGFLSRLVCVIIYVVRQLLPLVVALAAPGLVLADPPTGPVPAGRHLSLVTTSTVVPERKPPKPAGLPITIAPVHLDVAVIADAEFPAISGALVERALDRAAATFADKFNVARPTFAVKAKLDPATFLARYVDEGDRRCALMLGARYRGGGAEVFAPHAERAARFLRRWPMESLTGFLSVEERAKAATHAQVVEIARDRYLATVKRLQASKTSRGTALVDPARSSDRSFAAWNCALGIQPDFDVVITNTFILADLMDEPHPHAVFGKAKVGGIAGPNSHRSTLGGQALLVSTFGIDTGIDWLSELDGASASLEERAAMLGDYLLAHEVAHSVFGIPDLFDHPAGCLMTSRPGETYRQGMSLLREHPGPCGHCRPWVEALAKVDRGRALVTGGKSRAALKVLRQAFRGLPDAFHSGRRRRLSTISALVSRAYGELGRSAAAKKFAQKAVDLDPYSAEARRTLERWKEGAKTATVAAP